MSDESIREMAENEQEPKESELFPLGSLPGDEKTLGQLIRPNHSVEVTVAMGSAEVPSPRGGLLDPNKEGFLLVAYEVAQYVPVPVREGDRVVGKTLTGWKIRQVVRPIHVESVSGEAGAIESSFEALLKEDEVDAAQLLDRLKARAEKVLGVTA